MTIGNKIPAKLLIAGEFTVLTGGQALGIPFPRFYGQWRFDQSIDQRLENLYQYLLEKKTDFLHLNQFKQDILEGLTFQSNIPEGYGLGGSGALSAAVLLRYEKDHVVDLKLIQERLGSIESCFHGTSSGLDPLISYTQQGCLVRNNNTLPLADTFKISEKLGPHLYIIDSNTPRINLLPIQWFYEQLKNNSFKDRLNELDSLNSFLIQSILDPGTHNLSPFFQKISALQCDLFRPLIVPSILDFWIQGLEEGTYFCKLCGKGGGGFYYAWLDKKSVKDLESDYPSLTITSIT